MGLMQLMPAHGEPARRRNPYDPDENVRGGTRYLRQLLDRFAGRLELAVAAYNAGPGAVERHGGIPPYRETRDYVKRVLALYQRGEPALTFPAVAAARDRRPPALRPPQAAASSARPKNRLVVTTALEASRVTVTRASIRRAVA